MKRLLVLLFALALAGWAVTGGLAEGGELEPAEDLVLDEAALELDEIELPALDEALAIEALPELDVKAIDAEADAAPEANEGEADAQGDGVAIDAANFPDAGFRAYVLDNFDTDGDGVLSPAEIKAVTRIDWEDEDDLPYKSLKGIEFFTALKYLYVGDLESLTALDVTANAALAKLFCGDCSLKTLTLGDKPALKVLYCGGNPLTALDVSKCPALEELDCSDNRLTKLYLGRNTALKKLECEDNQLTTLDLSKCAKLEELDCDNNALTKLDVSRNASLKELYCNDNALTTLKLGKLTKLTRLFCVGNKLQKLDVSKCTALLDLSCVDNKLTALDIKQNRALKTLSCYGNAIVKIDLTNNPKMAAYTDKATPRFYGSYVSWDAADREYLTVSKTTQLEAKDRYLYPFRSPKKLSLTLRKTEAKALDLSVTDKGSVTGSSAKAKVAKCAVGKYSGDQLPVTITGMSAGTTTVKLVHKKTKQAVTVTVKVAKTASPTSISFKEGTEKTIRSWQTLKLTPVFKPANAWSRVTWKCSDNKLALVTEDGAVYPKNSENGTVTITATTANGKSAKFTLTLHSTMAHTAKLEDYIGKSLTAMKKKLTMPMYPKNGEFIHEEGGSYPVTLKAGVSQKGTILYFDLTGNSYSYSVAMVSPGLGESMSRERLSNYGWRYSTTTDGMEVYTKSGSKYKLRVAFEYGAVSRLYYGE